MRSKVVLFLLMVFLLLTSFMNYLEANNDWQYCSNYQIEKKLNKKISFKLSPYIADEIFYDFGIKGFNKNRIYVGIDFLVLKRIKFDLSYFLESNKKSDGCGNTNVIMTTLKYSF